jgi:hypothetical protein
MDFFLVGLLTPLAQVLLLLIQVVPNWGYESFYCLIQWDRVAAKTRPVCFWVHLFCPMGVELSYASFERTLNKGEMPSLLSIC